MNNLITGATGFVGSHLIRSLTDCIAVSRDVDRAKKVLGDSVKDVLPWASPTTHMIDLPQDLQLKSVINLMGDSLDKGRWSASKKKTILESRVIGTRNLVASLARLDHKPSVLVSASAVGYYGSRGDSMLVETDPPGNEFLSEVCEQWEAAALEAESLGIRVVLVRLGIVLGQDGGGFPKMVSLFRSGVGGRLGDGSQWFPWIHIDDLVAILVWSIRNELVEGPINATAPNPVTNRDFTAALAKCVKRWTPFPAPYFAMRLALGEFADCLFSSQRVIPKRVRALGFRFQHDTIEKCLEDLTHKIFASVE